MGIPVHHNNVGMTVSGTPGTGTVTLGSAITDATNGDHVSFALAYGAAANVDCLFQDGNKVSWERDCTYNHAAGTITRGTVERTWDGTSLTTSALDLTSAAKVFGTLTANRINRAEGLTRAQLNAAASASQLRQGEPYLITDEGRIALGLSASTYQAYSKEGEGGGGTLRASATQYSGTTQAITAAWTAIHVSTALAATPVYDTHAMWDAANKRINFTATGIYQLDGWVRLTGIALGDVGISFFEATGATLLNECRSRSFASNSGDIDAPARAIVRVTAASGQSALLRMMCSATVGRSCIRAEISAIRLGD